MDLQKGMKNNTVAAKYGILSNTVSTWKISTEFIAANSKHFKSP